MSSKKIKINKAFISNNIFEKIYKYKNIIDTKKNKINCIYVIIDKIINIIKKIIISKIDIDIDILDEFFDNIDDLYDTNHILSNCSFYIKDILYLLDFYYTIFYIYDNITNNIYIYRIDTIANKFIKNEVNIYKFIIKNNKYFIYYYKKNNLLIKSYFTNNFKNNYDPIIYKMFECINGIFMNDGTLENWLNHYMIYNFMVKKYKQNKFKNVLLIYNRKLIKKKEI